MMIGESGLRMNVSSAKQSRGLMVWSVVQGNVLGGLLIRTNTLEAWDRGKPYNI